jgi:putative hydrolase of the HAD superfamily
VSTGESGQLPQALFFDLDATLVYLDGALLAEKMERICTAVAAAHAGLDPEELQRQHRLITVDTWHFAESGAMDGRSLMRDTWRRALTACGCEAEPSALTAFQMFWDDRYGIVRLFDEVVWVLQQLKGRLPMAVITNGPADTQIDKLQVTRSNAYFDLFVASSEVGVLKPDPAIFRFAMDKLGLLPDSVWHIGDSLANDVAGAKVAGLTSVWLNREGASRRDGDPQPDHEIRSLSELPALLDAHAR